MSDFGISVRSLPNAVGLLEKAYLEWCDNANEETTSALKKQVYNVRRWATELEAEFRRDILGDTKVRKSKARRTV